MEEVFRSSEWNTTKLCTWIKKNVLLQQKTFFITSFSTRIYTHSFLCLVNFRQSLEKYEVFSYFMKISLGRFLSSTAIVNFIIKYVWLLSNWQILQCDFIGQISIFSSLSHIHRSTHTMANSINSPMFSIGDRGTKRLLWRHVTDSYLVVLLVCCSMSCIDGGLSLNGLWIATPIWTHTYDTFCNTW